MGTGSPVQSSTGQGGTDRADWGELSNQSRRRIEMIKTLARRNLVTTALFALTGAAWAQPDGTVGVVIRGEQAPGQALQPSPSPRSLSDLKNSDP